MRHTLILTTILVSTLAAQGAAAQSTPSPAPPPYTAPPPNAEPPPPTVPPPYGSPPPYGAPPPMPPPAQATAPNCREFTATVMIDGQPQPASGLACQRPDGSWQVTENAPGQPPRVALLPPGAIYASPYPDPYEWAGWAAAGLPVFAAGSVIFADAFHHFHYSHGFPRHHHGYGGRFHGHMH